MRSGSLLRVLAELSDLVLPQQCGGCGAPGVACCPSCWAGLSRASPRPWRPTPCPEQLPPTCASLPYQGPVPQLVVAWKDEGRRDLRRVLAPVLTVGIAAALSALPVPAPHTVLVPAPSARAARRRRGDHPLADLVRLAAAVLPEPPPVREVLALGRPVADQAGLTHRERAANLAGSMRVPERHGTLVAGRWCLLLDDVVTTGATLSEGARALRRAGASGVVAVTLAATPRRSPGCPEPRVDSDGEPG